jgi:hypothetical protein
MVEEGNGQEYVGRLQSGDPQKNKPGYLTLLELLKKPSLSSVREAGFSRHLIKV